MKISVVIPTYNRRPSLERCLAHLAKQTFPASEFEVLVVADGCTDGSVEFLRSFKPSFNFRWLTQPNQGAAAAQNAGVAAAGGDIIVFLDDDSMCDAGLLAAHDEVHARGDHVVAMGAMLVHSDSPTGTLGNVVRKLWDAEFRRLSAEGASHVDLMLCWNTSIARQAALECPFDTSYKRIHDVEAGVRLWNRGFRPQFVPHAVAYELYTKPVNDVLRDCRNQGKYEVILSNSQPSFKPLSLLARRNEANPLKRALLKSFSRHAATEAFLRPIYSIADGLRALPGFGWLARRVLAARTRIAHLSGAIKEAGGWQKLEEQFGKRVPVILYHNVGEPRPGEFPGLTTPVDEFAAQIRLLSQQGYKTILPAQWLEWRDAGGTLPQRPVMLVFDDAYAEACRNAFPILEQYGFGAACMVVTRCIGSSNRWDEQAGFPSHQLMSESEILEWSKRGIEFGGHTSHHPRLSNLSDECVEQEIAECGDDLTALLGKSPVCFAYPFGAISPAALAAARKYFQLAFTYGPGMLHLGADPHLAPRISFLPGETRWAMRCRLRFGKTPYEICRNRFRTKTRGKDASDHASPR